MSMLMLYLWCVAEFSICQTKAQTIAFINLETSSGESSIQSRSTITPHASPTGRPTSVATVDSDFPIPSGLTKTGATETTLNLRYLPPPRYRLDRRYTHFRAEYKPAEATRWKTFDFPKISDVNNLVLRNLSSGVLYVARIRSLRQNDIGDVTISNASASILARTKPLPVTQLEVTRSQANWSEVLVSWIGPPLEVLESEYHLTVLKYYIRGLNEDEKKLFPSKNKTFEITSLLGNRNLNPSLDLFIVAGAPYRFEVYTKSSGDDETTSNVMYADMQLDIPGPINVRRKSGNQTSLVIAWNQKPDIINTTGYQVTWSEDGSREQIEMTINQTQIEISNLTPSTRYVVLVRSVQNHRIFGKYSNQSLLTTRTDPLPVRDVKMTQQSSTELHFQFTLPPANVNEILAIHRTANGKSTWMKAGAVTVDKTSRSGKVILASLQPGVLYQVNISVFSAPNPQTVSHYTAFARTNPSPPKNLRASSQRGTIYVSWLAPNMYSIDRWRYSIEYYPLQSQNEKKTLCKNRGLPVQKISLPNLKSGYGYSISVAVVAGEDCGQTDSSSYSTRSTFSKVSAYTQPEHPTILFWKQVTVNSIRVVWTVTGTSSDSAFDVFSIGVRRVQRPNSFVAFQKEEFVKIVSKEKQDLVLRLSQGASYRINVTTMVRRNGLERKSVVIPGTNSIGITTWHRYYEQFPFPRLEWDFSTCGRSGRTGPSQLLCDSSYSKTSLHQLVPVEQGIQYWIAPLNGVYWIVVSGLYRIVAAGAGYEGSGGLGAVVSGLFHLKEGTVLKIGVGQRGKRQGPGMQVGGGGGSFVVSSIPETPGIKGSDKVEVLIVAGGAGCSPVGSSPTDAVNGQLSYVAGNGSQVGNEYGKGGVAEIRSTYSGMRGVAGTGGGAGYFGIADSPAVLESTDKSYPAVGFEPFVGKHEFLNQSERLKFISLAGGRYEVASNVYSEGGFGGGGSGYLSAFGGGGGYSGGGGGPKRGFSGGGGSFIKPTGGEEQGAATNNLPGYVKITVVGLPLTSPIPVTFYLVISFICGVGVALLCGASLYGLNRCADDYLPNKQQNSSFTAGLRSFSGDRDQSAVESNLSMLPVGLSNKDILRRRRSFSSSDDIRTLDDNRNAEETSRFPDPDPWRTVLERYEEMHAEENSGTLSTMSSVSSMATGLIVNGNRALSEITASDLDYESSIEPEIVDSFFVRKTHSSSPSLHYPSDVDSQQQKLEFRKKLEKFQKITAKSRTVNRKPYQHPLMFSSVEV